MVHLDIVADAELLITELGVFELVVVKLDVLELDVVELDVVELAVVVEGADGVVVRGGNVLFAGLLVQAAVTVA